ncbi:hypothetical protein SALBM311S_10255 [Streptomyces alboniger]
MRIRWAWAGLSAAAALPHASRAARSTSEASDIDGQMSPADVIELMDDADVEAADAVAAAAAAPCWPSPKTGTACSTVCPTASSVAIPGSDRSRPASGTTTRQTPRNPAPSVHSGTAAQDTRA